MGEITPSSMNIAPGLRVGFWEGGAWASKRQSPFHPKGFYTGPIVENVLPGLVMEQELMEGTLSFRVGVLFRPDLGKRHRLETILILQNYIPEMFDYETWSEDMAVGA